MQGEGKRRSEWNNLLLRDVIAPIYAALVARARDVRAGVIVPKTHTKEGLGLPAPHVIGRKDADTRR